MDHATTTESASRPQQQEPSTAAPAARVVGTLHRGALKEIKVDRLLNKPRYQPEEADACQQPFHKQLSSSLGNISYDHVPAGFIQSEPRHRTRRRCASGEECSPLKLFENENDFYHKDCFYGTSEAFSLKAGLRRRRKASPNCEHESLMKSIRQRASPTNGQRRAPRRSRFVIPMDHWFKTIWDILTVVFSIANAHAMHVSIRERTFGPNAFMMFCNAWFMLDILLNFVTERKTETGEILRDHRSICARYLTSWFAVDALSLMPWETLYVKPLIDLQNRRGLLQKSFFRSRAVVRVTRHLRGRHFRWFGNVAKHTKQHGVGANRLLRLIIKYVPKYVMFARNMKGAVAFRVLRQIQWFRRFYRNIVKAADNTGARSGGGDKQEDAMTGSLTRDDLEELDEDMSSKPSWHEGRRGGGSPRVQVVYEPWELMEDDDDGVPL